MAPRCEVLNKEQPRYCVEDRYNPINELTVGPGHLRDTVRERGFRSAPRRVDLQLSESAHHEARKSP